jgi:hypothetical protein
MLHHVILQVLTDDEPLTALMMEAVSSSETSVNIYQATRRNILEDSKLHNRRRENLNSHLPKLLQTNVATVP